MGESLAEGTLTKWYKKVGDPVAITADGPTSVAGIAEAATREEFVIVDLMSSGRRLGYAAVDDREAPEYLVYAERQLNPDPNVRTRTDEPFAQLDYAIYLNDEQPRQLISSSLPSDELPIDGRRESATSAFGNQQLLLVMTPIGQLSSWLFANLWWIVGLAGVMFSIGAAWLTRSLYKRREEALVLARENAQLYDEQRHIAYGTWFLKEAVRQDAAMADVIRKRLQDLLPHVAQSLSPPGEGALDILGVETGALAEFGLNALNRRLSLIGASL